MLKLKYSVKCRLTPPRKNGRCSILFQIHYNNILTRLFAGISITKRQWNSTKERIKQGAIINGISFGEYNKRLNDEESFINEYFNECAIKEVEPSLTELNIRFNGKFNGRGVRKGSEFYYQFDQYVDSMKKSRGWRDDMIDKHQRIKKMMENNFPNIKFSDLSVDTMGKVLEAWSKGLDGEGVFNDHISATLSCFRSFIKWARAKGCLVNDEFDAFRPKLRMATIEPRFLTLNELKQIIDLELKDGSPLFRVREYFLFQCGTALRYSDLKQLTKDKIVQHDDGRYYIHLDTQKNNKRIVFPMTKIATDIYLKHKDINYPNNVVFPLISNQKYNEYLKELGEKADLKGFWVDKQWRLNQSFEIKHPKKELGTHVARRTFISTAINEGVTPEIVALVSSHASLEEMKPYIGLSDEGALAAIQRVDKALSKIQNGE